MASIHRYLQSHSIRKTGIFFHATLSHSNVILAGWCSSRYLGTKMAYERVNQQKKNKHNVTSMANGRDSSGPNYPLIGIDVLSMRISKCVDRTHAIDKYATLDRISLMHSNNHKAVQLSNRNLLNGPFDQRSMVWTNDSRTNANDSDGASVCVFFLSSRLLKVLCCTLSHSLKKKKQWRMQFLSSINYLKQLP